VPRVLLLDLDRTLLDYSDDDWAMSVRTTCAGLAALVPGLEAATLASAYQRIGLASWQAAASSVMLAPSGSPHGHDVWREHWHEALASCGHADEELAHAALGLYRRDRLERYRLYDDVPGALAMLRQLVGDVAGALNAGLAAAVWLDRAGGAAVAEDAAVHRVTTLAALPGLMA
jgi:FMN phosphatase YigB (HAD superfamily)